MICGYTRRESSKRKMRDDHLRDHYSDFHYEDLMKQISKQGNKNPEVIEVSLDSRMRYLNLKLVEVLQVPPAGQGHRCVHMPGLPGGLRPGPCELERARPCNIHGHTIQQLNR